MSGWANSNVGGIGSTADLESRIAAAKTDEQWAGAGAEAGLQQWRIENFGVVRLPPEQIGVFYTGDCFIVLHTKGGDRARLSWDVYYWIGNESTTDERGTVALKTIELDDLLGTLPVQFRECEGHESEEFLGLFPNGMKVFAGEVSKTGFHHVTPEEYPNKLLHIKGKRHIRCTEVPCNAASLNTGDSFVLDLGDKVIIWTPGHASHGERFKAAQVAQDLRNSRKGKLLEERVDEAGNDEFWAALGGRPGEITPHDAVQSDAEADQQARGVLVLLQLSDASGEMTFTEVQRAMPPAKLSLANLDHDDVFIVDCGPTVLAWIGTGASPDERKKAVLFAHRYISMQRKPVYTRCQRVFDGREGPRWNAMFE